MIRHPKILVLEDDSIEIKKIQRALATLDIEELSICKNGIEGMNYLEDEKEVLPNLILLDLNMPKMNGHEFLEKIKKHKQFKKIPVLIFTTSNSHVDINRCYENQVAGYMVKPIDYSEYKSILKVVEQYWLRNEFIS